MTPSNYSTAARSSTFFVAIAIRWRTAKEPGVIPNGGVF
jgi:hypothetical protein